MFAKCNIKGKIKSVKNEVNDGGTIKKGTEVVPVKYTKEESVQQFEKFINKNTKTN